MNGNKRLMAHLEVLLAFASPATRSFHDWTVPVNQKVRKVVDDQFSGVVEWVTISYSVK